MQISNVSDPNRLGDSLCLLLKQAKNQDAILCSCLECTRSDSVDASITDKSFIYRLIYRTLMNISSKDFCRIVGFTDKPEENQHLLVYQIGDYSIERITKKDTCVGLVYLGEQGKQTSEPSLEITYCEAFDEVYSAAGRPSLTSSDSAPKRKRTRTRTTHQEPAREPLF